MNAFVCCKAASPHIAQVSNDFRKGSNRFISRLDDSVDLLSPHSLYDIIVLAKVKAKHGRVRKKGQRTLVYVLETQDRNTC